MLKEGDAVPADLKGYLVTPDIVGDEGKIIEDVKEVSLSSLYSDQILVLFFYPKDMTPGCTFEVQKFRDQYSDIQELGVNLAGCSKDSSKSHSKFISKYDLSYPLISDPEGKILDAFGVWGEKKLYGKTFLGIQRSTFIIRKGTILKVFPKVNVKIHTQEIIDFLKGISPMSEG